MKLAEVMLAGLDRKNEGAETSVELIPTSPAENYQQTTKSRDKSSGQVTRTNQAASTQGGRDLSIPGGKR